VDLDSTAAYFFELPGELIAAHPVAERDGSRLLVVRAGQCGRGVPPVQAQVGQTGRASQETAEHEHQPTLEDRTFRDLPDMLRPGDLLVRNETRVIPARLIGRLRPGGGKVEMLLLEPTSHGTYESQEAAQGGKECSTGVSPVQAQVGQGAAVTPPIAGTGGRKDNGLRTGSVPLEGGPKVAESLPAITGETPVLHSPPPHSLPSSSPPSSVLYWSALCRPARKLQPGTVIDLPGGDIATVVSCGEAGIRVLALPATIDQILDQHGHIPLPPYILHRRSVEEGADHATDTSEDRVRYQTVYARENGSVAAPTAGLHFTDRVLQDIETRGIRTAGLVLHVGIGTFRPMESGRVSDHVMHSERGYLPPETVEAIARTKAAGGRVIAVGTTSCRTLEGIAAQNGGVLRAGHFSTDIFIKPGHQFQVVNGMITNFHLPESTLMVLVSALAGHGTIMNAYRHAVEQRYRFFSYGDSMLIL
jgi:S-adenosylmethionine:tRNA ribosyltransferase-isomerase